MILEELTSILGLEIRDTGLPEFQNRIKDTIGKISLLGAGVIGVAAAITGMAASAAGGVTAAARFARGVDVSTQELQRLEFAAKQVGASGDEIRSFFQTVKNATDTIGTGGADALLNALSLAGIDGIDPDTGNLKNGVELLRELADAAFNANTQVEALNALTDLGISPQLREAFTRLGGAGFINLGAGAAFSDTDIRRAEEFTNAMERLEVLLERLKLEIGGPLLGVATDAVESFLEFAQSGEFADLKGDIAEINESLLGAITKVIALYRELAKGIPEDSRGAALLAGLGIAGAAAFPVAGVAAGGALLVQDARAAARGEDGTFTEGFVPGLLNKLDQLINGLTFLNNETLGPLGFPELPRSNLDDIGRITQGAVVQGARTVIESLTVNVNSAQEANQIINDPSSVLNDASERGTGGAR